MTVNPRKHLHLEKQTRNSAEPFLIWRMHKMRNKTKKIAKLLAFIVIPVIFLSGCGGSATKSSGPAGVVPAKMEIWDLYGDSSLLKGIFGAFSEINPNAVSLRYRKLTIGEYKQALIEAMASRQEPDIFLIHNTWLPYFKDKLAPVPKNIFNEQELRSTFPDVVADDFMDEGNIYALPLSIDSMALFYNKDFFNAKGFTVPPATWEEFNDYVKTFTSVDNYGNIAQSGAAIGTAYNINRSTDILGMLMLQNKVKMNNDRSRDVTFNDPVFISGESVAAGEKALEYYTQFARSNSSLYTWNTLSHWSIDSFAEGKTAMILSYSWNYEAIKNKNAKLNFAVAPVPQAYPAEPVNYANYWAFAVGKNKDKNVIHEAWQFLRFLTAKNNGQVKLVDPVSGVARYVPLDMDPARVYVDDKKVPAARVDIIEEQKNDFVLGPFSTGNLVAKSWFQREPEKSEAILAEAINSINIGSATPRDALDVAVNRINKLGDPVSE